MSSVPNSKSHREDSFAFISQKDTIHRVMPSGKMANILMNKRCFGYEGEDNYKHVFCLIIKAVHAHCKQTIQQKTKIKLNTELSPPGTFTLVKME